MISLSVNDSLQLPAGEWDWCLPGLQEHSGLRAALLGRGCSISDQKTPSELGEVGCETITFVMGL